MIIFSFAVLTLWLLCWVGWFFCLPGTKWFDKQMNYQTYDFHGSLWLIFVTSISVFSTALGLLYLYEVVGKAAFILCSACAIISFGTWCVSFSVFALADFHKNLRNKRNY